MYNQCWINKVMEELVDRNKTWMKKKKVVE